MMAVVNRTPLSLRILIVASPDVVASFPSQRPARQAPLPAVRQWRSAPTRSPASSSGRPLSISSTVLRTSSLGPAFSDSSFKDTMGSAWSASNMLLVSTTRIISGRAVPSFLSGRYSAAKVRKKSYVTCFAESGSRLAQPAKQTYRVERRERTFAPSLPPFI